MAATTPLDAHPIGALLALGPRAYARIGNGAIAHLVRQHGPDVLDAPYDDGHMMRIMTPLSHAIRLLLDAYAHERSVYWPHVTVCRLLELGAHRLAPAHAGLGPPWCALLALLLSRDAAGAQLRFGADIGGRDLMRSAHVAHWTHLLTLLEAMRRHTPRRLHGTDEEATASCSAFSWRFVTIWRERILPDLLGESHHNVPALRHLVHLLLHELLPLRSAPEERALLATLLSEIRRCTWRIDPWLAYTQWGALGALPTTDDRARRRILDALPHCARRTRLVRRLLLELRLLPVDVCAHIVRLHNRSLMLPPFRYEADQGWDLRLRLDDDEAE